MGRLSAPDAEVARAQIRYRLVDGIRVEPIDDDVWVAFSPLSGDTTLLNDTSAATLEVLAEATQPCDTAVVSAALAADCGEKAESLAPWVEFNWPQLLNAGLVRAIFSRSG